MFNAKTVLILAPHTDDGEIGCGGTIARFAADGANIHYVAFSICETSVPTGFPPDILATEVKNATQTLNIPAENLTVYRYPVRQFLQHRQEILENLVTLKRTLQPDIVFLPSTYDIHQDHQVIAQEGIRAFKHSTILGYELPWNNLEFNNPAFISLTAAHIQLKLRALHQYRSQAGRSYAQNGFIESLARVRGQQANQDYAESFQVIKWIIR